MRAVLIACSALLLASLSGCYVPAPPPPPPYAVAPAPYPYPPQPVAYGAPAYYAAPVSVGVGFWGRR